MSRTLPSRFEYLAGEIAERVAPLLAERVAAIVAQRYGELPPLLDTAGAARYLGVDEETVRRLARRGDLPGVVRLGKGPKATLRFDPEALRKGFSPSDTTQCDGVRPSVADTPETSVDGVSVAHTVNSKGASQ